MALYPKVEKMRNKKKKLKSKNKGEQINIDNKYLI